MDIDDDKFGKYVRCRLPMDEWFQVHDQVSKDTVQQERLRSEMERITDAEQRVVLKELHEALASYASRFAKIFGEFHGDAGGGTAPDRSGGVGEDC